MEHVLIVDDDAGARATLAAYLKAGGFRHSTAESARAARGLIEREMPDLLLVDVKMPGEDGLTFVRELRRHSDVPVILVSALGEEIDRVVGLEIGADDYVVKPVGRRELLARIRAILRRIGSSGRMEGERSGRTFENWFLDLARRRLTAPDGKDVPLTRGEFDLLEVFTRSAGRVLTRDQILDLLPRSDATPNDRTIDVMVRRLRHKTEPDPKNPALIVTVYGVGYMFAPEVRRK